MTEEKINALRQADTNMRDALRMDETERPQMPADLNERLMQRMAVSEKPVKRRVVWPWIAAACVAGVMIVWLMPPRETPADAVAENTVVEQPSDNNKVEEPKTAEVEKPKTVEPEIEVKKVRRPSISSKKPLLAQKTKVEEPIAAPAVEEVHKELAVAETAKPEVKMVTLTERDIPITRPENYKYTPEEIALLKKQANEAYLKWAELELEIARYNLEQTAQNDY